MTWSHRLPWKTSPVLPGKQWWLSNETTCLCSSPSPCLLQLVTPGHPLQMLPPCFVLNVFHLTRPHMWDSEALCSLIWTKAFSTYLTLLFSKFFQLMNFFRKRRQLKQNMVSALREYSSHRLFSYHFFWNDRPSTFFGNDSNGWQGPIFLHLDKGLIILQIEL